MERQPGSSNSSNEGFPAASKRFPDPSEEGEIGEEEGEIVIGSNPPPPPPPPPLINPNTSSAHRSISNSSTSGAPPPPFPAQRGRRKSWGGNAIGGPVGGGRGLVGRGVSPNFAGRGRSIGNRHVSFTGAFPPLSPPQPQVRSQSFAGFQNNAGGPNAGMMQRRPTDPRFRGGDIGGATSALARSGSFSMQESNTAVLTSSYSSLAELSNPHSEMISRSTSTDAAAESWLPRDSSLSFHEDSFSRNVPPPPAASYRALDGDGPDRFPTASNTRQEGSSFVPQYPWSDGQPFREQAGQHRDGLQFRQQGGPPRDGLPLFHDQGGLSRDIPSFHEPGIHLRDGPPFRETSFQENIGSSWRGNEGSSDPSFVPHPHRDGIPISRSISEVPQHAESSTIGNNYSRPLPSVQHQGTYRGFQNDFRGEQNSDFSRPSSSQRGPPMFSGRGPPPPPPSAARKSSFGTQPQISQSTGTFATRRLDPRFQNEITHAAEGYPQSLNTIDEDGQFYGDGSSSTSPFRKAPPRVNQHLSMDSFGRRGDQTVPNPAAAAPSPQPRKPVVLTLFQPSQGSSGIPPSATSLEIVGDTPLLTTALGNKEDVERAEKVVTFLSELTNNDSLGACNPGEMSELPKKHLILQAVSLVDTKMKDKVSYVKEKETELEAQLKADAELLEKDRDEYVVETKRKENERLQLERETDDNEAEGLEAELKSIMKARKDVFDKENADGELLTASWSIMLDEIRMKREEEIMQQLKAATELFDKELEHSHGELDRSKHALMETQSQLAAAEISHKEKVKEENAKRKPKETQHSRNLVTEIIAENRRRAIEANISVFSMVVSEDENQVITPVEFRGLDEARDPKYGKTSSEWAKLSQQVSGLADALYDEPEESPFFGKNQDFHAKMEPLVKEFVRDKNERLNKHWTELAEEYEFRSKLYRKKRKENEKKGKQLNSTMARSSIIARTVMPILESTGALATAPGRTTTNPYRRARRGNEVRSEYEQEQIIAEIAAKEAMETRIAFGGCKTPRQVGAVERELTVTFYNTFIAQKVDVVEQERLCSLENVWTDTEKCIFLDRFLQHPKDFRKIATFLRNKTTRDCIKFYYDSKQTVSYKGALKEHIMRRKRRGDYHTWDATIQAALSVGAVVTAGFDEDNPLTFVLPENECTYNTRDLHPLKQDLFDLMEVDEAAAAKFNDKQDSDAKSKSSKSKKRKVPDLFLLDLEQRKFLRPGTPEPLYEENPLKKSSSKASVAESCPVTMSDEPPSQSRKSTSKKWTAYEKKIFIETVEKTGRNWRVLEEAIGSKSISQIKNYYYDWKKGGKEKTDKKAHKADCSTEWTVDEQNTEDCEIAAPVPMKATLSPLSSPVAAQQPLEHSQQQELPMHQQQHSPFSQPSANLSLNAHQVVGHPQSFQMTNGSDMISQLRQMQLERSRSSGASSPDLGADLWAQAQLLQSQHQQSREDAFRVLLQQHQQQQQPHILSSFLPFLQHQHQRPQNSGSVLSDWGNDQQLQDLFVQNMRGLSGGGGALHQIALAGIPGLSGLTHQQQDSQQLALQHILAMQQQQHQSRAESSNNDALALLVRALSEGRGNFQDPGNNP